MSSSGDSDGSAEVVPQRNRRKQPPKKAVTSSRPPLVSRKFAKFTALGEDDASASDEDKADSESSDDEDFKDSKVKAKKVTAAKKDKKDAKGKDDAKGKKDLKGKDDAKGKRDVKGKEDAKAKKDSKGKGNAKGKKDDSDDSDAEVLKNGKAGKVENGDSKTDAGKVPSLKIKRVDNKFKSVSDDQTGKDEKKAKKGGKAKSSSVSNGYKDSAGDGKSEKANGHAPVLVEDTMDVIAEDVKIAIDSDASEEEVVSKPTKGKKGKGMKKALDDSDVSINDLDAESSGTDGYEAVDSDEEIKKKKKVSESDGEESDVKPKKKQRKARQPKAEESGNEGGEGEGDGKKKKGKGKKRRRIKKVSSSDEEEGDLDDDGKTRKKIRKIIKDKKLSLDVKSAVKAEEERRARVKERQKLYNQVTEIDENSPLKTNITTKLVLDVDENKEPLIQVHPKLIRKLKPHQVEAVKFVWDCTVESMERMKEDEGAGCILAHCMGLGKTLSCITFCHTMLYNGDKTNVRTCLVVCPLNTVLNWQNEWTKWFDEEGQLTIYELSSVKDNAARARELDKWHKNGGVMILGYEMYRNLVMQKNLKKKQKKLKDIFTKTLTDPGPDLVVCDEGHMLKNANTSTSKAMSQIKTKRRVVLTGTPLQNNLVEYHCMVDFVKPKLLGTKKEFLNRFVNPILNGQCADSSEHDVKLMKKRAHILHETLSGCVQRRDYTELTKVLLPLHEYVLAVRLAPVQQEMYDKYMEMKEVQDGRPTGKGAQLFSDYQALMRIWTHPWVLKLDEIRQENRRAMNGEFDDFIDEDEYDENDSFMASSSEEEVPPSSPSESEATDSDDSQPKKKGKKSRKTRRKRDSDSEKESGKKTRGTKRTRKMRGEVTDEDDKSSSEEEDKRLTNEWWGDYVTDEDKFKHELSGKMVLLAEILRMCENIGDKVLVFSQSLLSLDLIEAFLEFWDSEHDPDKRIAGQHRWVKNIDYFRMDGSTSAQYRKTWSAEFNDEENERGRLFLISTRAGSLGTNLIGANRVIIFDASWNPSHDIQSIFRVYRFGQMKPCYIYRFLAQGTMEEKIYERQVTKQSLSQRVVDEHQIERHFSAQDLQELYRFTPLRWTTENEERETPALPTDRLLAELLTDKKDWIVKYHRHDSLLENKVDEDLTEEERKTAWEEYEAEKKGVISAARSTYSNVSSTMQMNPHQQAYYNQIYGGAPAVHPLMAPQQPSMSLGSIEQVARAIYAANPGITQQQLQLKVQDYIEMVTAQQRVWYQQQQMAAMAGYKHHSSHHASAAGPSSSKPPAAPPKPRPTNNDTVIDLDDSSEDDSD